MPDFWTYFWYILGAVLVLGLSFYVFMILFASHMIYVSTLKRKDKTCLLYTSPSPRD